MKAITMKLAAIAVASVTALGAALVAAPSALAQGPSDPIGPGAGWMSSYSDEVHDAAASALGMTSDELYAAMADGQTMVELAAVQGVDVADVWAAMQAAREDVLAGLAADGTITQDQADWMASRSQGGAAGQNYGQGSGQGYNQSSGQSYGQGSALGQGTSNGLGTGECLSGGVCTGLGQGGSGYGRNR